MGINGLSLVLLYNWGGGGESDWKWRWPLEPKNEKFLPDDLIIILSFVGREVLHHVILHNCTTGKTIYWPTYFSLKYQDE